MAVVVVRDVKYEITEEERAAYEAMLADGFDPLIALQIATGGYRDLITAED